MSEGSPTRFAELLSTAIHRIRIKEKKNISVIQDELGQKLGKEGGSMIEYWRKGNIPSTLGDLEVLAEELVNRKGLENRKELEQFLPYGDHPRPTDLCDKLFPLVFFSEDGGETIIEDDDKPYPPLEEFDLKSLEDLSVPRGAIKLRDKFYIKRTADEALNLEVAKWGTTTTIRASRQMGKTSLLVRGAHHAVEQGYEVVRVDMQNAEISDSTSSDNFLRYLAEFIVLKLQLGPEIVEEAWRSRLGAQVKLTHLLEDYILPERDLPFILAMDEVDSLLKTTFYESFFGMVRSWHNNRASDEEWDKLNIVLVISTEPYLIIRDKTVSPFNVAKELPLDDFNEAQVSELNKRHGSPLEELELSKMMTLLNGHPYLTRMALYTLVTEGSTWIDLAKVATTDNGPFGDHLRRCHWMLLGDDNKDLRKSLKEVIHHKRCKNKEAFFRLHRSGLVKGNIDRCTCRCDLYTIYFSDKL